MQAGAFRNSADLVAALDRRLTWAAPGVEPTVSAGGDFTPPKEAGCNQHSKQETECSSVHASRGICQIKKNNTKQYTVAVAKSIDVLNVQKMTSSTDEMKREAG